MKQLDLFKITARSDFGGTLAIGRRHSLRPLSKTDSIHLVLRARGTPRLLRRKSEITATWQRFARRFGIRTYQFAVCGNHLHALIRIHDRGAYVRFVRAFTGTMAKRMNMKWEVRPFTRLVKWGRAFARAAAYVRQNYEEAEGLIAYRARPSQRARLGRRAQPPSASTA